MTNFKPVAIKITIENAKKTLAKKPIRHRPSVVAREGIRKYQRSGENPTKNLSLVKLVREMLSELKTVSFDESAITALEQATAAYLEVIQKESKMMAIHFKRNTVMQKDVLLAHRIRGSIF